MTDSPSGQHSGGEARQEASPPESHQTAEALNKLVGDVRALGAQLLNDIAALAHAQWRLTSYVVAGSARIWSIRIAAFVVIAVLALASWILLNVTVWQVVAEYCPVSYAPPLVLLLLNSGTAAFLFLWQKGLRLQ